MPSLVILVSAVLVLGYHAERERARYRITEADDRYTHVRE